MFRSWKFSIIYVYDSKKYTYTERKINIQNIYKNKNKNDYKDAIK